MDQDQDHLMVVQGHVVVQDLLAVLGHTEHPGHLWVVLGHLMVVLGHHLREQLMVRETSQEILD